MNNLEISAYDELEGENGDKKRVTIPMLNLRRLTILKQPSDRSNRTLDLSGDDFSEYDEKIMTT